jgi:hypothetical protein
MGSYSKRLRSGADSYRVARRYRPTIYCRPRPADPTKGIAKISSAPEITPVEISQERHAGERLQLAVLAAGVGNYSHQYKSNPSIWEQGDREFALMCWKMNSGCPCSSAGLAVFD